MAWQENLFSNIITILVLFLIFVIVYCKMTGSSLLDIFRDIRDIFRDGSEEVYDNMQGGFKDIIWTSFLDFY